MSMRSVGGGLEGRDRQKDFHSEAAADWTQTRRKPVKLHPGNGKHKKPGPLNCACGRVPPVRIRAGGAGWELRV